VGAGRAGAAVFTAARRIGAAGAAEAGGGGPTTTARCSLKKKWTKKQIYKNREVAIAGVTQYIDSFYNSTHRSSR
jgi:hypothetical protein